MGPLVSPCAYCSILSGGSNDDKVNYYDELRLLWLFLWTVGGCEEGA